MADGAAVLLDMGYEVIDVNLACPVKRLNALRGGHFLARSDDASPSSTRFAGWRATFR